MRPPQWILSVTSAFLDPIAPIVMEPIVLGSEDIGFAKPSAREPSGLWRESAIRSVDSFTVPTLTFGVLYGFFVIDHDRRKILHLNVSQNPSAPWVALQLRQTWAYDQPPRFLIFDRDAKFNADVVATVEDYGMRPLRTALRSPWQNGIAERWVGSVRRDLLDHVIVVNQRHLRRLMKNYIRYYHEDRTHLGLGKDTSSGRVAASASPIGSQVISLPRLGGLHHRYAAAA